jgi:hypothetical protein
MRSGSRVAVIFAAVVAAGGPAACDSSGPGAAPRPFPQVPTLDGAVLAPLEIVTIAAAGDGSASSFFDYSQKLGGSVWWSRIAPEYHLGKATAVASLRGPAITGATMTDHDVFTYIENAIADGGPARDGHTLFLLYLPAGVTVVEVGQPNTNCNSFGGYHARFGTLGDNLAVIQRCADDVNAMIVASHEVLESATDPDGRGYALPGIGRRPWQEPIWNAVDLRGDVELADLCEGSFWVETAGVFQRIWSNRAAAAGGDPCVPALGEPYFNTSVAQDWYTIPIGQTASIPITGWSTGSIGSWGVTAEVEGSVPGFSAIAQPNSIGAGDSVTLTVTAPANAASNDFAVILLESTPPPVGANQQPFTDSAHLAYVGVYIP